MNYTTSKLPVLPFEIIENILFYLMDDEDTLDYLQTVPELTSMIINYRRSTVNVSKTWTWLRGGTFTIEDFYYERLLLNYKPRLVVSDILSVCQILDLGVDLQGIKFKIDVEPYDTNEQIQRVISNVNLFQLGIDRTVKVNSGLRHLGVSRWSTNFPPELESLNLDGFLPQLMPYVPPTITRLLLTDPQLYPPQSQLPISIRELRIEEQKISQVSINLTYLVNLRLFEFKGNVEKGFLNHLLDIQLPTTIESLSLECTRMVSLNGLESFTNLHKLRVIDCPNLILFFTPEFPSSLTYLEFSFKNCRQKLFERNRVVFQIPGRSPLDAVRFVYANGGFILAVEDEFNPPPLLKTLILKNHQEIYFGPKLNLPNLQTLVVEKIFKLNCGRLLSGLSTCDNLNALTLKDSSIDCIDDVKFPKNLYHLDLSDNLLSSIRNTNLRQAKHLRKMDLSRNRFISTNNIDIPNSLQAINMYYNELHLCNIPDTNLTKLDIELSAGTEFSWNMLPTTLMYVTIKGDGHYFEQVPNTFQSLRKLFLHSWLQPIRLQNLNFAQLSNLYDLEICAVQPQKCNKVQLPQPIVNFFLRFPRGTVCQWPDLRLHKLLKTLIFESVSFDEIDLDTLPLSLEELKISYFHEFPARGSVRHLTNLRVLDISDALINGLPSFFVDLPESLTVLKIDNKKIAANCADYINCSNLQLLTVFRFGLDLYEERDNVVAFISNMVAKCPKLRRVFVRDDDAEDYTFQKFGDLIKPQLGYSSHPERWCR